MKALFTSVVIICILCQGILSYYVASNKRILVKERGKVIGTYALLVVVTLFNWAAVLLDGLTGKSWYISVHWIAKALEHSIGPFMFILFADFVGIHPIRKLISYLFSLNAVVQIISLYTKLGFYIDEANVYHKGKWGYLVYFCSIVGFAYAIWMYTRFAKTYKYKNNVVLTLIGVLELFSVTVHLFIKSVNVDYIGAMVAMVLIYIYMDDFKKQQQDDIIFSQLKIMQALVVDYDLVYDVNLQTEYFEILRMSEEMNSQIGQRFKPDTKFEVGINAYMKLNVYHYDMEMFASKSKLDVILSELESRQAYVFEYRVLKDDAIRYYSMRCVKCEEGDGTHLIVAFRDVDDQKVRWEKLVEMSNTDQMTSLYNRRAYNQALEKSDQMTAEDRKNLTGIMIDLNNLKGINDNLGHEAGDELIISASKMLGQVFNDNCSIFRLGGDEFVVLAKISEPECRMAIDSLRSRMAAWKGVRVESMSASIGYARADESTEFIKCEEIVKIADTRMYEDKKEYYRHHDRRH